MNINYNYIIQTAIGGAIGAGISGLIEAEKSENPLLLIGSTLLLGQAIAWAPSLVGRCCARRAAPQPQEPAPQPQEPALQPQEPAPQPQEPAPLNDPDLQRALNESKIERLPYDRRLQQAIASSIGEARLERKQDTKYERDLTQAIQNSLERKEEKKRGDEALARALELSTRNESQIVKICSLQRVLNGKLEDDPIEDDEIIPNGFEFSTGNGTYYHAGNLVVGLLSSNQKLNQIKDPFGRPIQNKQLRLLADMMGISGDDFLNIWFLAKVDRKSEHIDPEEQASLKTDFRFKYLRGLLENSRAPISKTYLAFFKSKGLETFK